MVCIQKKSGSRIIIEFDCDYLVNGTGTDSFESKIVYDGVSLLIKGQFFLSGGAGGGTRSGVLLTIRSIATSTGTSAITISFQARRIIANDNVTFFRDGCNLTITELSV